MSEETHKSGGPRRQKRSAYGGQHSTFWAAWKAGRYAVAKHPKAWRRAVRKRMAMRARVPTEGLPGDDSVGSTKAIAQELARSPSDEELIARAKADPESRARLLKLAEEVRLGMHDGPSIGADEMPAFLAAIRASVADSQRPTD